ncbi:MAG: flagellar protein FlaG [Nitrospinae bacterium]|nr:flagellar protein FlaG [Nitrospinota bacterium]
MIQNVSEKLDSLVQHLTAGPQRSAVEAPAPPARGGTPPQTSPPSSGQTDNTDAAVTAAVDKVNYELKKADNRLSLAVDRDLNRVVIKYKDSKSGEVVRQIPTEAVLDMVKQIDKLKGMMFDSHG